MELELKTGGVISTHTVFMLHHFLTMFQFVFNEIEDDIRSA